MFTHSTAVSLTQLGMTTMSERVGDASGRTVKKPELSTSPPAPFAVWDVGALTSKALDEKLDESIISPGAQLGDARGTANDTDVADDVENSIDLSWSRRMHGTHVKLSRTST